MKKKEFVQGIKDGFPICLGYFSVSMAFGLRAVLLGMPVWSAVAISLFNLTSAGQFAGLNILVAQGTMVELALTTLIINMRYFLMSLSVSQKVHSGMKMLHRLAVSYGITDEIFAVSMQYKSDLTGAYMAGLILTPVLGWTGGTLFGAVAASFMPSALTNAMGIALYGMFIAIIIPPAREQKSVLVTVVMAIVASLGFTYLPVLKNLSGGWAIIVITLLVSGIAAWLFPIDVPAEDADVLGDQCVQENVETEVKCQ
ncbi:MAG: AzlC family ABC transporter permease [Lachnospiraceae bacterium]|nr:AzlC family ABC transporter permease [Lachnospiraceae bacterium]